MHQNFFRRKQSLLRWKTPVRVIDRCRKKFQLKIHDTLQELIFIDGNVLYIRRTAHRLEFKINWKVNKKKQGNYKK